MINTPTLALMVALTGLFLFSCSEEPSSRAGKESTNQTAGASIASEEPKVLAHPRTWRVVADTPTVVSLDMATQGGQVPTVTFIPQEPLCLIKNLGDNRFEVTASAGVEELRYTVSSGTASSSASLLIEAWTELDLGENNALTLRWPQFHSGAKRSSEFTAHTTQGPWGPPWHLVDSHYPKFVQGPDHFEEVKAAKKPYGNVYFKISPKRRQKSYWLTNHSYVPADIPFQYSLNQKRWKDLWELDELQPNTTFIRIEIDAERHKARILPYRKQQRTSSLSTSTMTQTNIKQTSHPQKTSPSQVDGF